jgi:hypothetical protein
MERTLSRHRISEALMPRSPLDGLVAFIRENLITTLPTGLGRELVGVSETARRFNETRWLWTDDNAKVAELLCEPEIYDTDPTAADAAIDFVLRMSESAVIKRRCGTPEVRILSKDPAAFRVETAFFIVEGDLTRGVVRQALRSNDGRSVTAAQHTGNSVHFRYRGRNTDVDVEDSITEYGLVHSEHSVVLWHASTLKGALGRLKYSYEVRADRPTVELTVELTAQPGVVLEETVVTTAFDQLSAIPGVDYHLLRPYGGADNRACGDLRDDEADLDIGPLDYISVVQEGVPPGFSYAIHSSLPDGNRFIGIHARGQKGGRLHWLRYRYRVGSVSAAEPGVVREHRMLTGGGYYEDVAEYLALMRDASPSAYKDTSMSYDIGAELNAVAVHILFARTHQYTVPLTAQKVDRLIAWYDRHVERYFEGIKPGTPGDRNRIFSRGLAFVVLSLDCMVRATQEPRYRQLLETGVALILRMQRRESRGRDAFETIFCDSAGGMSAFLDCHAACLLALARAAWHGDPDGTLSRTVHEGILGIRLYSGTVDLGNGHLEAYDGLGVADSPERGRPVDTGFWTFKIGLVLRALRAIQRAAASRVLSMSDVEAERVALRLKIAQDLVSASIRRHGDILEVLTSSSSGETNSETQPWVTLGSFPIVDERIVMLGAQATTPASSRPLLCLSQQGMAQAATRR